MKVISMVWIILGHSFDGYSAMMFVNKIDIQEVKALKSLVSV